MSGKGKSMVWQDWQTGYETAWHGLIELDSPVRDPQNDIHHTNPVLLVDTMEAEMPSQEEAYIKKEAFQILSQEAKEIIMLILNSPMEVLSCFKTEKYDKISREKVGEYLLGKGWDKKLVQKCFSELKSFAAELH